MVSQIVAEKGTARVIQMSLPDAPVITGNSQEVFDYYGLNESGIAAKVRENIIK